MVGARDQSEGVGTLPQRMRRDFSAVGYDEAMRRAREIVPVLRERAQRAEDARMLIRDNEQLLHESGLFRFHQPKAFGGMELDFVAVVDIPAELARGCPSTAWSVGNVACHHWILGYYDRTVLNRIKPYPELSGPIHVSPHSVRFPSPPLGRGTPGPEIARTLAARARRRRGWLSLEDARG